MGILTIVFVLSSYLSSSSGENEKRLLLNDPSHLQQEIQALQTQVQALQNEPTHLQQEIQALQIQVQDLKNNPPHLQQEIQALQTQVQTLENNNSALQYRIQKLESNKDSLLKGGIFIHWGKKSCDNATSSMIYSGFAGGTHWKDSGASAKTLCLPSDPIFLPVDPPDPWNGYIYGSEYHYDGMSGQKIHNEDAPCSVCQTHSGDKILMIPARNQCYKGWRELYNGLLIGSSHNIPGGIDYLCMDKNPDSVLGGSAILDGRSFHLQKAACGSLKCPPYQQHRVVTCVVCTR